MLIGKTIGNYTVKAKLGEGGMGVVYLGEHPLIGKKVAIKVLLEQMARKEDVVSRFFHEAKAVNDIGHPNIVDIIDFGKSKDEHGEEFFYFIMEYLDGDNVGGRLAGDGLTIAESLHITRQSCSALAASHAKGIIHRDLKPDNIFLCRRGTDHNFVKILDFGVAKLMGDGSTTTFKTRTGAIVGTPVYMSPEQCKGGEALDARSDIYSLGGVLYQLLTGRVPFLGEGLGEVILAHMTLAPDRPTLLNPAISPEVEAIALRALEKARGDRFQSMDEFAAAIDDPAAHLREYEQQIAGRQSAPPTDPKRALGATKLLSVDPSTRKSWPPTGHREGPTTLSGTASEVIDPPLRRKRHLGVALALGGVALAIVAILTANKTNPPPPRPLTPDPPRPVLAYKILVMTEPTQALVYRDSGGVLQDLGPAPQRISAKAGDAAFDIVVKMQGYHPTRRTIVPDGDKEILIELAKETPQPSPVEAPKEENAEARPSRDTPLHDHESTPRPTGGKKSSKGHSRPDVTPTPPKDKRWEVLEPTF